MTQAEESLSGFWLQHIPEEDPTGVIGRFDKVPPRSAENQTHDFPPPHQDPPSRCKTDLLLGANLGKARKMGEGRVRGRERGEERRERGDLAD